jgi:hypothetical protein
MPRSAKGPRLWLRPARNDGQGRHAAVWIIKDAGHQQSTGCAAADIAGAEHKLEQYLNAKHTAAVKTGGRDPAAIPIADVLNFYAERVAPRHARPKETLQRIRRLSIFFYGCTLAQLDGELCRAFTKARGTTPAARGDLVVLRSAINFHTRPGAIPGGTWRAGRALYRHARWRHLLGRLRAI